MSHEVHRDPLFYRSFYLTVGGLFLILPIWIWLSQGDRSGGWPLFAWILFYCLPVIGLALLIFGIAATDRRIVSMRIVATGGAIIISALSIPFYLIFKACKREKRER